MGCRPTLAHSSSWLDLDPNPGWTLASASAAHIWKRWAFRGALARVHEPSAVAREVGGGTRFATCSGMVSTKLRLALASLLLAACAPMLEGCAASTDEGVDSSEAELALSSSEHTAYNYFRAKGLTSFQAAAVVGNLIQESSVNPKALQYGGGPGRGIAQWSVGGRWNHDGGDNPPIQLAHENCRCLSSSCKLNVPVGIIPVARQSTILP